MDKSETPANERDPLARLIRSAGRRPAIESAREQRVHSAVHGVWQRTVRRRRIRRWAIGAGSGLAAAVVAFTVYASLSRDNSPVATLDFASGNITSKGPDGTRTLKVGDGILPGSTIETTDNGRAAVTLTSGQSVRLDNSTSITIKSASSLALGSGGVYVDSEHAGKKAVQPLEVRTNFGIARDEGTQFEVRLATDSVRVRVREGKVKMQRGSDSSVAEPGTELTTHSSGPIATAKVSLTDSSWDWAASAAPPFKLEGATLQAYLSWVGRELAWEVHYSSEELRQSAPTIHLHGTLSGISPRNSVDAVLPVCGLTYTLSNGVLTVAKSRP
jgi:ferric-dicitrate binding protein FerR (iron transport regulator)